MAEHVSTEIIMWWSYDKGRVRCRFCRKRYDLSMIDTHIEEKHPEHIEKINRELAAIREFNDREECEIKAALEDKPCKLPRP